jgi:hypothetical protein
LVWSNLHWRRSPSCKVWVLCSWRCECFVVADEILIM